jgi:hypothetical protein
MPNAPEQEARALVDRKPVGVVEAKNEALAA